MRFTRPMFFGVLLSSISASGCGKVSTSLLKNGGNLTSAVASINCTPGTLTDGPNSSKFVQICPGTFIMGSPDSEAGRHSAEGPQHPVTISKAYEVQATEVTQPQWQAVMGSNPSRNRFHSQAPVEQVSWNDVQAFIGKLNALGDGYHYRLPTEAEWEYAARAGWAGPFAGRGALAMAWYDQNSLYESHPVATKEPNDWGLYDMHGNVIEWAQDYWGYYSSSAVTDPVGPTSGSYRVVRGGGWSSTWGDCRSADRYLVSPDARSSQIGFRLLRTRS